ncbi:MAG: hypothetical protein GJU72_10935 [Acidithiobacillus ferriphilus]|jgi:hypothetical protein|nr:hypothetical protein [Acidithiobacillus ferriphilus]
MNIGEIRDAYWCNAYMPGWIAGYLNDRAKKQINDLGLIASIVQGAIWYALEMFIDKGDTPGADASREKVDALTAAAKIVEENPELVDALSWFPCPPEGKRSSAESLYYTLSSMAGHLTRSAHIHAESARRLTKRNTFFYCLGYALERPYITKAMRRGDYPLPLPTRQSAAALYVIIQSILGEHAPYLFDGMVREYPTEHDPQIMRLMKAGQRAARGGKKCAKGDE